MLELEVMHWKDLGVPGVQERPLASKLHTSELRALRLSREHLPGMPDRAVAKTERTLGEVLGLLKLEEGLGFFMSVHQKSGVINKESSAARRCTCSLLHEPCMTRRRVAVGASLAPEPCAGFSSQA